MPPTSRPSTKGTSASPHNRPTQTVFSSPPSANTSCSDKSVLAFHIHISANKPIYFGNNLNNTFVRVGSGDQRATDIEIDILMREKTFGMKSEMEVDGTRFGDLNSQSLQTYRRRIKDYNPNFRYNDLDDEQFCIKTGIISREKLTYGGLLMLGKGEEDNGIN